MDSTNQMACCSSISVIEVLVQFEIHVFVIKLDIEILLPEIHGWHSCFQVGDGINIHNV